MFHWTVVGRYGFAVQVAMTWVKTYSSSRVVDLCSVGASLLWHLEGVGSWIGIPCSPWPNFFPQYGLNILAFHQNQIMVIQKGQKISSLFSICIKKKLEVVVARMCALKLQYFHASQPSNNLFHCFEYSLGSVSPLVKLRHNSVVSVPEQCAGDMLLNLQLKIALACFLFLLYLFINSHLIWWPLSFFRFLQHYSSQGTYLSLSLIFAD